MTFYGTGTAIEARFMKNLVVNSCDFQDLYQPMNVHGFVNTGSINDFDVLTRIHSSTFANYQKGAAISSRLVVDLAESSWDGRNSSYEGISLVNNFFTRMYYCVIDNHNLGWDANFNDPLADVVNAGAGIFLDGGWDSGCKAGLLEMQLSG